MNPASIAPSRKTGALRLPLGRCALAVALAAALSPAYAAGVVAAAEPSVDAIAAARKNNALLLLRAGVFDPLTERLNLAETGANADGTHSGLAIVQFEAGRLEGRKQFAALGADIAGYIPNNAYLVRTGGTSLEALRAIDGVRWAGAYQAGYKVDPKLWSNRRAALVVNAEQRHELEISGFAGQSMDAAAAALHKQVPDLRITNHAADRFVPTLRVSVASGDLARAVAAAAALDAVGYIEPYLEPTLHNAASAATIQGNASSNPAGSGAVGTPTPLWDHQITGSNQIVAVMDSGLDRNEAWFTTLDKGAGPVAAITDSDSPVLPAIGTVYPNNKVYGYFVQPGASAYDNNASCGGVATGFHGSHVSGTVAGDAAGTFGAATYLASTPLLANHELADGMAPNAQLLFQDIGNDTSGCLSITNFGGSIDQAHAAGAHIQNNSWGGASRGAYTARDAEADSHLRELDTMLLVVSAGNSGRSGGLAGACATGQTLPIPGDNKYQLCLQTTGSPGNGKNVLTIGASAHGGTGKMTNFSSRGPTADGRQKPDIVAPGNRIISASGDVNNANAAEAPVSKALDGTSMSAPTISGNVALVRQFYSDGFYPRGERTPADMVNPSGALLKAVLLNGATPELSNVGTDNTILPWPNIHSGWGRAWLDSNLWFKTPITGGDDSRRTRLIDRPNAAGLKTGESDSFTIANATAGKELRVTLTWFDPPSLTAAGATLVNNLDLEVTEPGGSVYKGNVLTGSVSVAGGSADVLNTVEQVRLTTPVAGSYTVTVRGTAVPGNGQTDSDAQGYALAITGGLGLPDAPALAAPTALTVAANGGSGVAIGFAASPGAQGYQLYRASGSCATVAAGDFRYVASGAASPLLDTRSQGGFPYAYKLRGLDNDVEGDASACIDVTSAAACTLEPTLAAGAPAADGTDASCSVALAWPSATARCPASTSVTYAVERSADPYFGTSSTVASGLTTPTWTDVNVVNGTPYYYRMRGEDSVGNLSPRTPVIGVTPAGAAGPAPATYNDNVDNATYLTLDPPWQVTNAFAADGTYSYRSSADGATYPASACIGATTPALTLPAAATLSFEARYNFEQLFDGARLEISTDGGTTWADLPPVGGYPTTMAQSGGAANGCGFAATQGVFGGVSTAASNSDPNNAATPVFKPFSADLAAFAGQSVKIRWLVSSDGGLELPGLFLDKIRIGQAGADAIFDDGFEASANVCQ